MRKGAALRAPDVAMLILACWATTSVRVTILSVSCVGQGFRRKSRLCIHRVQLTEPLKNMQKGQMSYRPTVPHLCISYEPGISMILREHLDLPI